MLKIILCIKRKPEMTRAEFRRYWTEKHSAVVAAASGPLGILRNVHNHTIETALDDRIRAGRGAEMDEYDGIAESWFESVEALVAATATPEGSEHARLLAEDEMRFIDFSGSRIMFVEEHVVLPGSAQGGT